MNESRDELYYQIIKLKDKIAELEAENERFRRFITQIEPLDKLRQERDEFRAALEIVVAGWNKGGDIVGPMLNAKKALSKNK